MKRGKELRGARGQPVDASTANELMALMFVMVDRAPGAFRLRLISNDELLQDLQRQGSLESFLDDVDQLYADFRKRFEDAETAGRPN